MSSHYSLIQITSDPVADERINLGLVVVDDKGGGEVHFTSDLRRASKMVGPRHSTTELERLIAGIRDDFESIARNSAAVAQLREIAESWKQSIRVTQPRASLLDTPSLIQSIMPRALPTTLHQGRSRDRRQAISIARSSLKEALLRTQTSIRVKNDVIVPGRRQPHRLDLGLVNGSVRRGVTGLSLEGGMTNEREREISALKWLVDDVKAQDRDFPVSVLVLADNHEQANEDLEVLRGLGADVVAEANVQVWAEGVTTKLA